MKNIDSISTIVIGSSFALLTSVYVIMLPFTTFFQSTDLIFLDYMKLFWGGGGFFLSSLIYFLLKKRSISKIKEKLGISNKLDLTSVLEIDKFDSNEKVEYRIYGQENIKDNPNIIIGEIETCVINEENFVFIPSSFFARFRTKSEAFAAVIYHELAHILNKDNILLFELKRFLSVTTFIFIGYSIISFFQGSFHDEVSYISLYSNFIGKSYNIFNLILIACLFFVQKLIIDWREALADKYAIEKTSIEAKNSADSLIKQNHIDIKKPLISKIENSLILTPSWIILTGFILSAFTYKFHGQFIYLKDHIFTQKEIILIFQFILDFSFDFVFFIGSFFVLNILIKYYKGERSLLYVMAKNSLLLLLGSSIYFLFFESLPLALPSWLMPSDYDYIIKVDPFKTLIIGLLFQILSSAFILPIISSFISYITNNTYFGVFIGFFWSLISVIELYFFPEFFSGYLSFLLIVFFILFFVVWKIKEILILKEKIKFIDTILLLLILTFSCFHLFGYGDLNYYAKLNNQIGLQYLNNDKPKPAESFFIKAIKFGRCHSQLYFNYALSLIQQNKLREAVVPLNIASNSKYEYEWNQQFLYFNYTGTVLLRLREKKDLEEANKYFQKGEFIWRNNSRISKIYVVSLLYNMACLKAIQNDKEEAILYLFEALSIDRTYKINSLSSFKGDSDLKMLFIKTQSEITKSEIEVLRKNINTIDVPSLRTLVSKEIITTDLLLKFIDFAY